MIYTCTISRLMNLGPLGLVYVERRGEPNPPSWKFFESWVRGGERFVCLGRFKFIHTPRRTLRWLDMRARGQLSLDA